jgi:hypothetical protein
MENVSLIVLAGFILPSKYFPFVCNIKTSLAAFLQFRMFFIWRPLF